MSDGVRDRLLEAAMQCFMADDYHRVSTRMIAEKADANIAMIRYYFGNKEGLYEEMIRESLAELLDELDQTDLDKDLTSLFSLYYRVMTKRPEFPKLVLKTLALNQAPGRRYLLQLLERGRSQSREKVCTLIKEGRLSADANPDIIRMAFVSLAITPMLLKDIFEEQMGSEIDSAFFEQIAQFNGELFSGVIRKPVLETAETGGNE